MFSLSSSLRKLPIIEEKEEKNITQNFFEWSSREVSLLLNGHSLFEARPSSSESCAYRFEQLLAHMSERWDYLNEFEWSERRVKVENSR